jgi:hypothetical protein
MTKRDITKISTTIVVI